MQASLTLHPQSRLGTAGRSRPPAVRSRRVLVVRAYDDDDVLPIFRLPTQEAPESLPMPHLLGGKTIGDELGLIHNAMVKADEDADKDMHAHLYSANWQGDEYIGSNWNILTVLMGLTIAVPMLGLLFAWLSYGTLWTGHYYGV